MTNLRKLREKLRQGFNLDNLKHLAQAIHSPAPFLLMEHIFLILLGVVKVIVLVDRHEGGSDRLRQEGYDFTALLSIVH